MVISHNMTVATLIVKCSFRPNLLFFSWDAFISGFSFWVLEDNNFCGICINILYDNQTEKYIWHKSAVTTNELYQSCEVYGPDETGFAMLNLLYLTDITLFNENYRFCLTRTGSTESDQILGSFCGRTLMEVFSTGPTVMIVFHSDRSLNGAGFSVTFKQRKATLV